MRGRAGLVAGAAERFETVAEIFRQCRVADHVIGIARRDAALGLGNGVLPLLDVVIAAADKDQCQQIGLLLDIEARDEVDHLAAASVLVLADALGVLDRDELAVVPGRRLVAGGRRDFARDLARRLDQGADLIRADTQLWHGSSVLKRRTEGPAWAIHVRRNARCGPLAWGDQPWAIWRAMIRRWISLVPS